MDTLDPFLDGKDSYAYIYIIEMFYGLGYLPVGQLLELARHVFYLFDDGRGRGAKTFLQIVQIRRLNKNRQQLCGKQQQNNNKKGNMNAFAYTHTYIHTYINIHAYGYEFVFIDIHATCSKLFTRIAHKPKGQTTAKNIFSLWLLFWGRPETCCFPRN